MSSTKALPSILEGEGVRVAAPEAIGCSLTFGEVMFGLMRMQPRTGHTDDLEVFLKLLVEDTRLLFGGTGAAVALLDGQVCRWRKKCGETGPQIGSQVYVGSAMSGGCLASGRVQWCQDTLTDPRLDAELCRQLRLRSMIVAPIRCPARVEGILEVWSSRPFTFDSGCAETLQKLADFSGRVTGLGRGFDEQSTPALIAVATQRVASFGRDTLGRARRLGALMHTKLSEASAEFSPLMMRVRTGGILPGILLSTVLGAAWYGRAAGVSAVPASLNTRAYLSVRETLGKAPIDTLIVAPLEKVPRPQRTPPLAPKRSRPAVLTTLPETSAKKREPLLVVPDVGRPAPVVADDALVPPFLAVSAFGAWNANSAPLAHLFASVPVNPPSLQKVSRKLPVAKPDAHLPSVVGIASGGDD
jgi:hypothetical protein